MLKSGFAGNRNTLSALEDYLASGRFPHALLLCGDDGVGKGRLALLCAMALCCTGSTESRPCGICSHCHKITAGIHPDVTVYGETKGAKSFHVDQIRHLIGELYIKPNEAACKVFILKNCENLSGGAANALLKALEEPPANTYFILTALSKDKLIPTILSRVTAYTLLPPSSEEALPYLLAAGCEKQAAEETAFQFDGNIGRSIAYLTDETTQKKHQLCQQIFATIADKNAAPLSLALLPLEKQDRTEVSAFLDLLYEQLNQLLRRQLSGSASSAAPLLPGYRPVDYAAAQRIIADTADRLRRNGAAAPAIGLMAARLRAV